MTRYVWTIRNRKVGKFLAISKDGSRFKLVDTAEKASHFDSTILVGIAVQKLQLHWTPAANWSALDLEVLDQTINQPEPEPDADTTPVRTLGEVMAGAVAAGHARRERSAAKRAASAAKRAARPGMKLVKKPAKKAADKKKAAAKKTGNKKKAVR